MRNSEIIARWRAKQAQGRQHGWVAVEKHEIHSWINTHVENKTRIVVHRKKLRGPVPQNTWRDIQKPVWSSSEGTDPPEMPWKIVTIETRGLLQPELGPRCLCIWQRPELKPNFGVCNFHYIKISKNWAKIVKLTALHRNRFKIRMTPISNTSQIDGASVIEKLHIPSFCCKIHYTHARYYIVSVHWV